MECAASLLQEVKDGVNGRGRSWALEQGRQQEWPQPPPSPLPGLCGDCAVASIGGSWEKQFLPLELEGRGGWRIPKSHSCIDPLLPSPEQYRLGQGGLGMGGNCPRSLPLLFRGQLWAWTLAS